MSSDSQREPITNPEASTVAPELVCARICLNTVELHFGHNEDIDSLLLSVHTGKITPIEAIQRGMQVHLRLANNAAANRLPISRVTTL